MGKQALVVVDIQAAIELMYAKVVDTQTWIAR
jgi:hypothetical protein